MIVVLAGTVEGRRTALLLAEAEFDVTATAVSEYGAELLRDTGVKKILPGSLEYKQFADLLDNNVESVVDATHPYAVNVSRMALKLCGEKGISYLRLERPASDIPENPLVKKSPDFEEVLDWAVSEGKVIFSTLGSKSLPRLVEKALESGVKVIARVLPEPEVLAECRELGLKPSEIIAAQGPFSRALNRELFRAYGAGTVLTKESGASGGVDNKINAALDLGINVTVWTRPVLEYPAVVSTPEEALEELKKTRGRGL